MKEMLYTVKRNKNFLAEVDVNSEKEAIDKAQDDWLYEKFGQGGALREGEKTEEEKFLGGTFTAEINFELPM
jgi:hypothetical protein